jgi:hypothetical protein
MPRSRLRAAGSSEPVSRYVVALDARRHRVQPRLGAQLKRPDSASRYGRRSGDPRPALRGMLNRPKESRSAPRRRKAFEAPGRWVSLSILRDAWQRNRGSWLPTARRVVRLWCRGRSIESRLVLDHPLLDRLDSSTCDLVPGESVEPIASGRLLRVRRVPTHAQISTGPARSVPRSLIAVPSCLARTARRLCCSFHGLLRWGESASTTA